MAQVMSHLCAPKKDATSRQNATKHDKSRHCPTSIRHQQRYRQNRVRAFRSLIGLTALGRKEKQGEHQEKIHDGNEHQQKPPGRPPDVAAAGDVQARKSHQVHGSSDDVCHPGGGAQLMYQREFDGAKYAKNHQPDQETEEVLQSCQCFRK